MNAILNYPGAKWGMAQQIVSMMPSHRSYLEPFFGSGAVLFNKPPSAIETVNDIDGDIVNFFKVLKERASELAEAISFTPYAREVFEDAHENRGTDSFDRAYRFAIRSRMGHGFKTYQKTGFKMDIQARERSYCVANWNNMPEMLLQASMRLKCVQIENRPALDLIRKFNYDNVLIYADPPYLLNTRGGKQYQHEMNDQDHLDLLAALVKHKGPVILSGYPSEMYDCELKGWHKIQKKSYNQNADARTEVLWCNFELVTDLFNCFQEMEEQSHDIRPGAGGGEESLAGEVSGDSISSDRGDGDELPGARRRDGLCGAKGPTQQQHRKGAAGRGRAGGW